MTEMIKKYNAPALDKGLDILELLSESEKGLSLNSIAQMMDKTTTQIYRMLDTLVHRGYVIKKDDLYYISLKVLMLANRIPIINRLRRLIEPSMRQVTEEIEQPCFLSMISNGKLVVISSCVSSVTWNLTIPVGTQLGFYNTGTGRTILAYKSKEERRMILENYTPLQGETEIDKSNFEQLLTDIRNKGYCQMESETIFGAVNLAFPIFYNENDVIACLTTPYLKRIDAHSPPNIDQVVTKLKNLSENISQNLS